MVCNVPLSVLIPTEFSFETDEKGNVSKFKEGGFIKFNPFFEIEKTDRNIDYNPYSYL